MTIMESIDDPGILDLVGGDQAVAHQLIAIVTHIFETIWEKRQRLTPMANPSAEPPTSPPEAAPAAPATSRPSHPPRLDPSWRASLLGIVGGDPSRLEDLVDTVAHLWQAILRKPAVPG